MEREISYSETMQGRLRAPVFRRLVVVVPSRREHRMDPRGDEGRERDVRDESASVCLGGDTTRLYPSPGDGLGS